jgi:hypothetical protein
MKIKPILLKATRAAKLALSIVGAVTIMKYGVTTLLSLTPDPDDDVTTTSHLSPDGKYNATYVSRSGGGAIAPFCSDKIFVFNNSLTINDVITHPEYEVYSAECDIFFNLDASPQLKWNSNNNLQIDFATNATQSLSREFKLRGSDASEKIQVRFSGYR